MYKNKNCVEPTLGRLRSEATSLHVGALPSPSPSTYIHPEKHDGGRAARGSQNDKTAGAAPSCSSPPAREQHPGGDSSDTGAVASVPPTPPRSHLCSHPAAVDKAVSRRCVSVLKRRQCPCAASTRPAEPARPRGALPPRYGAAATSCDSGWCCPGDSGGECHTVRFSKHPSSLSSICSGAIPTRRAPRTFWPQAPSGGPRGNLLPCHGCLFALPLVPPVSTTPGLRLI